MTLRIDAEAARKLRILLASTCPTIVEMAREIGEDSATFFEGEDWSGLDLRPCDLAGISFAGAVLDNIVVYSDQLVLIEASRPKSIENPIVHQRSDSNTTVLPYQSNGLYPPLTRAEYVHRKMAYQDMVDKGWNPPIAILRSLLRNAESFGDAVNWLEDLCGRSTVIDSRHVDCIMNLSESVEQRIQLVRMLNFKGVPAANHAFNSLVRSIKNKDDFSKVWMGFVEPLKILAIANAVIEGSPSIAATRNALLRMRSLGLMPDESTFFSIWYSNRNDEARSLITEFAESGNNGAIFCLSELSRLE